MADEKTNSEEDSTRNTAFAIQTDEDVGFLSMQNEMAGPVGIADNHNHDRSSSNPRFTAGFSRFANNDDGISNLAHNVGRSSSFARKVGVNSSMVKNANEFFGAAQNMHGWNLNNNNAHFVPGFGGNMGAGFQVVDSNNGFQGQQFPAHRNSPVQTVEYVLFPERKSLQLPDTESSAAQVVEGQVMPVARGSGPAQVSNFPIGLSHMRYTTQFPPIARPIQRTTRSKKPSTHQSTSELAQATPPLTPLPEIYPVPPQARTAASLLSLPMTVAFLQSTSQSTTFPSQAQTAHPPSPLVEEIPSLRVLKGQVMPVARGNGPAQASNVPVGPSHLRYTTRFPPIACPSQRTTRSKQPSTHQSTSESAQSAPSLTPLPEIYPVPPQAQTAASLSPLPRNVAFLQSASQSTILPSQAQTAHPPSPLAEEIPSLCVSKGKSKIIVPTWPSCQGKLVARGRGLAQASNASVRPQKRGATQPPSFARPGQRRATIQSSVPASFQTAPPLTHQSKNALVPPQDLTAASVPSFPQTADYLRTLSLSHALPYPLQTARPYSQMAREIPRIRMSQDSNKFPQPIGYRCCLCNLDLSFTPEGLILQPGIRPTTAVLSCGHHFHDLCLQQIIPADQIENPQCIECNRREIEEGKLNEDKTVPESKYINLM